MLPSAGDFTMARWGFARLLGVIFFCAFASLAWQIRGLAGAHGIVPAASWLEAVWLQLGAKALWQVPTICWLGASDSFLVSLCLAGMAVSILLAWGECFPAACALTLWALYLSLCWVTNPFLGFQWDALLLETALLAALWLPWQWKPDWRARSIRTVGARWLLWWLLFRLMFQSGVVKLASGDATWRAFTALDHHFETQPLPLWTAWFAHQVPEWILCVATAGMFVVELAVPFLIVAPRAWRHGAAWSLIALQILIAATGNYAFFNYLTIALCLTLFDDAAWPARWRRRANPPPLPASFAWWTSPTTYALGLVFLLTLELFFSVFGFARNWRAPWSLAQFMSFNRYGLFAVMTTTRHEIEVEGSDDGVHWRAYEFPWKPGDLNRRPGLVAPHQPRLDWQMWFAALGTVQDNPWFVQFLVRLLEGSPEVLGLLQNNPFPDKPPTYLRASLYDYHFTRLGDAQNPGWWQREKLGLYCPMITLRDGKPTIVADPSAAEPR